MYQTIAQEMPSNSNNNELVKCNRCKNIHKFSERLLKPDRKEPYKTHIVCPKCECTITIKPYLSK